MFGRIDGICSDNHSEFFIFETGSFMDGLVIQRSVTI